MVDFSVFEEKIGVIFKHKDLLKQAFTHRSYINEHQGFPLGHNERLEFLGDAVLELAVTEYLFEKYPNKPCQSSLNNNLEKDIMIIANNFKIEDQGKIRYEYHAEYL